MNLFSIKPGVFAGFGVAGAAVVHGLGGWDTALQTLVLLMAVDFVTGLIVAGVFKRSGKSRSGALDSKVGFMGLTQKGVTLLIVLVAHRLDAWAGTTFIRNGVISAYIVVEAISITENAGLMGVPIPAVLARAIEALKRRGEEGP